jgi:hypothetical protein
MFTSGSTGIDPIGTASEALNTGNLKEARQILRGVLVSDKNNTAAWELLYRASYNNDERIFCLERILQLQPNHPWAQNKLGDLKNTTQNSSLFVAGPTNARSPVSPAPRNKKRNRALIPFVGAIFGCFSLLCAALWTVAFYRAGYMPFALPSDQTLTAVAAVHNNCQKLIDQALTISDNSCDKLGSNQACYGNNTVQANLVPGASKPFDKRGDIIEVAQIQRISAAPLNNTINEWGIAIFKVMANLPRSLPGETVTMMVFGNTTLDNAGNLETFYFSSKLGQIVCDQVPFDGLMITMPEGTGIHFTVNGSELTLMGNASLKATKNGKMQVGMYSGTGVIEANGQQQVFTAGEQVSVPLGGPNGTSSVGPPSSPEPLSPDDLQTACTMTGSFCSPNQIVPITSATAAYMLTAAMTPAPTSTATPRVMTNTPKPTLTTTKTSTITSTPTKTFTATPSKTLTRTPTGTKTPYRTATKTKTKTPAPTATKTYTPGPTGTRTKTPTITLTRTITLTPSITLTRTTTFTPTITPTHTTTPTRTLTSTRTVTATQSMTATVTSTRTITPTFTQTDTPTITLTPVPPTDTSTPTHTLTPTITATPMPPTDTRTPTATPAVTATPGACGGQVTAGTLTLSSTQQLQITITNNTSSAINIQTLDLEAWPGNTTGTHLTTVSLDAGNPIWSGNKFVVPLILTGLSGDVSIGAGATRTLIFDFNNTISTSGTSIYVFFDISCHVNN